MDLFISEFIGTLPTLLVLLVIVGSLFTLSKGADTLVDEAVNIATTLKIPKAIIGATIVSLGTTLPELSVSTLAAINGNPDLALGNAVGSVIVNTSLIIGISAMLKPIKLDLESIKVQGWLKIISAIMLILLSMPIFYKNGIGRVSQLTGFFFILVLVIYLYWSFKQGDKTIDANGSENPKKLKARSIIKLVLGMAVVIISSKILIPAVEITALKIGIPQSIIAATLVAFGTSLPELTTSVKAVLKGHGDLAVGNVIGADILNILFVIGASAAVTSGGLVVPEMFYRLHFPIMGIVLMIFRYVTLNKGSMIRRREGLLLFTFYLVYLGLNMTNVI